MIHWKERLLIVDGLQPALYKVQWGLFTKWRRWGSAGHFCTRVHAGCIAGCVRQRKTHLWRATFYSFCLNTLRVILDHDLCVRRTWKIMPEEELEHDFSIFFGSMTLWAVWDSEQRTTLQSGLNGDTDCGCRRQATPSLVGFCFPHRKTTPSVLPFDCSGFVFAVTCIGVCHRLTATSRLPHLANSLRYICIGMGHKHRHRKLQLYWCSALHRSTMHSKLDEKEVFLEVDDTLGPLRL